MAGLTYRHTDLHCHVIIACKESKFRIKGRVFVTAMDLSLSRLSLFCQGTFRGQNRPTVWRIWRPMRQNKVAFGGPQFGKHDDSRDRIGDMTRPIVSQAWKLMGNCSSYLKLLGLLAQLFTCPNMALIQVQSQSRGYFCYCNSFGSWHG